MCNTDQMNNKNCGIGRLQVARKQGSGVQPTLDYVYFDHQEINGGCTAFETY